MIRITAVLGILLTFAAGASGSRPSEPPAGGDAATPASVLLLYGKATREGFTPRKIVRQAAPYVVFVQNQTGLGGIYFTMTRERRGRFTVVQSHPVGLWSQRSFIIYGEPGDRFHFRSPFVPGRLTIELVDEAAAP